MIPLIKPEYHITYNSFICKGNYFFNKWNIQGNKNTTINLEKANTPIIQIENKIGIS